MAEIELSILSEQRLDDRIADEQTLRRQIVASFSSMFLPLIGP